MALPKMRLDMKFGTRGEFLLALLLLLVISNFAITRTSQIKEHLEQVTELNNGKAELASRMALTSKRQLRELERMAKATSPEEVKAAAAVVKAKGIEYLQVEKGLADMLGTLSTTTPKERELLAQIKKAGEAVAPLVAKAQELALAGNAKEAVALVGTEVAAGGRAWTEPVTELVDLEYALTGQVAAEAGSYFERLGMWILLSIAVMVVVAIGAAWFNLNRAKHFKREET